ncbi:MAG: glutathione S-transferase family protein, partial [Alphaproteobacteria bacterium]|nr:glutathione S-transferase family protein [Alphaproteobacteria bacterium]
ADIATFPWTRSIEKQGHSLDDYPNVKRWFRAIEARPAVQRGLELLKDSQQAGPLSDKAREMMFGATQFEKR